MMIVVLWLFQTVFIDEFYEAIKIRNMKTVAETVLNSEQADLDSVSEKYDACIMLLSENLAQISQGSHYRNGYILRITPKTAGYVYDAAMEAGGEILLEVADGPEMVKDIPRRIIYARIGSDGRIVLIETVFSTLGATVETIRIQLYWVMGMFLIIGMVFAVVISRYTSKPIEKITRSAKLLASGDYNIDFNVNGYKEITELSNTLDFASKELSKVEGYRKELLANLSHDLRTPLTMITAYAEAMRDIPGELTSENVQIIIDETNHLTALVNDLLDLSRIQEGSHMLNKVRYNLTKSILALMSRYNKLKEQDGFDISFEYDREVYVLADESKITQVAYNLINNAVNYTGEDKKIAVRQVIDGSKVRIEVSDTGAGIPENQLQYIWDRYYKIDSVHKRSKQGTGIGLSIVKGMMELHNERYGVSSRLGQGSTFWFELTIDS